MKLKSIILCLIPFLFLFGCSTVQQIPVETIEKIEIRDSLIYITDSILIEVEKEVIKEVLPEMDTSYLETSLARSTAYLDTNKRQIHHTLEQSGTIKTELDTAVRIQYVDRIVEKEIPIITEVEKIVIPTWCWLLLIGNVLIIAVKITRFIYKQKA